MEPFAPAFARVGSECPLSRAHRPLKWPPEVAAELGRRRRFAPPGRTTLRNGVLGALREDWSARYRCFSLFFPGIISEQGVVFGRNPGFRWIRRAKKQRKHPLFFAVFARKNSEKISKNALMS